MKHDKIPLASVKALTLRSDRKTAARRTKPVPQLMCTGGSCVYAPDVVQCVNVGDDGTGAQWKCEANLPTGVRFGELEVVCEGWSRAGDKNVLAGSCALEYQLVGRPTAGNRGAYSKSYRALGEQRHEGPDLADWLFYALFAIMALWLLRGLLRSLGFWPRGVSSPRTGGGGGGGGGPGGPFFGGGGGWNNPPPPYHKTETSPHATPAASSSGPGFWTGLAAGAAGTALYNRAFTRERRLDAQHERREREMFTTFGPRDTGERSDSAGGTTRTTGYGGSRTR